MNKILIILSLIAVSLTLQGQDNPNKTKPTTSDIEQLQRDKYHQDGLTSPGERCGTTESFNERLGDPKYQAYVKAMRQVIDARGALLPCDGSNTVVIPVAVHYDSSFNCDDTGCLLDAAAAQIATLNEDFAATNADLSAYQNILSTCMGGPDVSSTGSCISFCLATENHPAASGIPDGVPAVTVGYSSGGFGNGGNGAPDWPGYLNLFVVNGGPFGVADGIPGALNGDGVTCSGTVFGGAGFTPCTSGNTLNDDAAWNLGRTMTHEVGHYLGLYHVWGDVNGGGCGGDDMITDTPDQSGPSGGCTANCATLAVCNPNEFAQYNFMDYFDDACLVMFSEEQASVMNTFANNVTWAANTGCSDGSETSVAACSINAAFSPADGTEIVICTDDGNTISLIDESTSAVTWDWTFAVASGDLTLGATTDNNQNPTITVTGGTSGTITVTLEACDGAGDCSTVTQTYTVTLVSGDDCPDGCDFTLNLTDSFGDGWNGATVEIFQNGVSIGVFGGSFTTGSTDGPYIITLEDGATIDIVQTNGSFPGEEGFTLVDQFGFNVAVLEGGQPLTQTFIASCSAPTCDDGIQNGDETGVDCGGSSCGDCCGNGVMDADETGIDCGGAICDACATCMDGLEEILSEDFDGCALPMGWSVSATDGGIADILFTGGPNDVPGGQTPSPDFAGCIVTIDDDANDAIGIGCVTTPIIDMSQVVNGSLNFDWQNNDFAGTGDFIVEVFDGTAWIQVFIEEEDAFGTNETIDLSAYSNSDFQIRFCYDDEGAFAWGAGFDNVNVCGQPNDSCPAAITTNDISGSYCDGSAAMITASPGNSNVTYAWSSSNPNVAIVDAAASSSSVELSALTPCQIETADISLVATCNLDGTELFNGVVSTVSVYPAPPADITTLVVLNENTCDAPILVDPNCAAFITLTPDAANPTFPVALGESGTASYTINYASPAGAPDCCPDVSGATTDIVVDGSFEAGPGAGTWVEASSNFGTPICDLGSCGNGTGTGPSDGDFWAWFGGIGASEIGSVCQAITVPANVSSLTLLFDLETIICDSPADFMEVTIDGTQVFLVDGSSATCGNLGYVTQTIDLLAAGVAGGSTFTLCFESEIFGNNGSGSNFFVDNVQVIAEEPAGEDICEATISGEYDCVFTAPEEIPTMGEWGLMILGLLILICSIVAIRERNESLSMS